MIRKATDRDIDAIEAIYNQIFDKEESEGSMVGWIRGVYPTKETALCAINSGELYVSVSEDGTVTASARINFEQMPEYEKVDWLYSDGGKDVLVLHTLAVSQKEKGKGIGRRFMSFYEQLAREYGCSCVRIDTNAKNTVARAFYARLGYREAGVVPCTFNGIEGVDLVCLEKKIEPEVK